MYIGDFYVRLIKTRDVKETRTSTTYKGKKIPLLIVEPKEAPARKVPGVLWIHGGGYMLGMKEMAYMCRALDLVRNFGVKVVLPGYRLSWQAPYPAAIEDCYGGLLYLKEHAAELGIDDRQIMVGGESAGGGLTAALCILARDRGEVNIAFQMPLYPMLDNLDTETSRNNHGHIWNTRLNHIGWQLYLRKDAKRPDISPYASPSRETNYEGLPPAYTFVGTGEPFYAETLKFVQNLQDAGVPATVDFYETDTHAFDMLYPRRPERAVAAKKLNEAFSYAIKNYFTEQG